MLLAIGLALSRFTLVLLATVVYLLGTLLRTRVEEQLLAGAFGTAYAARVPGLSDITNHGWEDLNFSRVLTVASESRPVSNSFVSSDNCFFPMRVMPCSLASLYCESTGSVGQKSRGLTSASPFKCLSSCSALSFRGENFRSGDSTVHSQRNTNLRRFNLTYAAASDLRSSAPCPYQAAGIPSRFRSRITPSSKLSCSFPLPLPLSRS